jgi:phosphoenolpyruvate carboxylase
VQTFTIQSAFKFDYPEELVKKAISIIRKTPRKAPIPIEDEAALLALIEKMSKTYSRQVERLNKIINTVARYAPSRRKRKLHTGLFGYTRAVAGKRLPRAISFCAALYSIGLPPELLGLSDLKPSDVKTIQDYYPNFLNDLMEAMAHYDPLCLAWLPLSVADDIRRTLRLLKLDFKPNLIHQSLTGAIRARIAKNDVNSMSDLITQAARERRFLG